MPVTPLVDVDDAKAQLNIDSDTDDLELYGMIVAATEIVNRECGYSAPTQFTETVSGRADASGRSTLVLGRTPVLSVQSITPQMIGLPTWDITGLVISAESGTVYLPNWFQFYGPLTVVYTAGRAEIPEILQTACLMVTQYLWETQRGGAVMVPGTGDDSGAPTNGMLYQALELMRGATYTAAPGIA